MRGDRGEVAPDAGLLLRVHLRDARQVQRVQGQLRLRTDSQLPRGGRLRVRQRVWVGRALGAVSIDGRQLDELRRTRGLQLRSLLVRASQSRGPLFGAWM